MTPSSDRAVNSLDAFSQSFGYLQLTALFINVWGIFSPLKWRFFRRETKSWSYSDSIFDRLLCSRVCGAAMNGSEEKNGDGQVKFGLFDVDLNSGELRRSGVRVHLQSQPFKLLIAAPGAPG